MTKNDKKTHKGYRLSRRTLRQIDWLTWRLDTTATAVIERAIDELYEKTRASLRSRLIPGEDGWYHFLVDDVPLLSITEAALPHLGRYREMLLSEEGADGDYFVEVLLLAANAPPGTGGVITYDENIHRLYGLETERLREQGLLEAEKTAEKVPAG